MTKNVCIRVLSDLHNEFRPNLAAMAAAADAMTDLRRIRVSPSFRKWRPSDVADYHMRSMRWLRARLQEGDPARTVVVTHRPLAGAYAWALDELIAESRVALWVHGHTHCVVDYLIGATRVVSNPRGYLDDPLGNFDPNLVVEI